MIPEIGGKGVTENVGDQSLPAPGCKSSTLKERHPNVTTDQGLDILKLNVTTPLGQNHCSKPRPLTKLQRQEDKQVNSAIAKPRESPTSFNQQRTCQHFCPEG